ncbi:MAG: NAD(P)-binding domain-containing protein, partial [Chloroflexota bacterium]
MNIGILGSGVVGQTVGKKLVDLGHVVMIGTRDPQQLDEAKGFAGSLRAWLASV